MEQIDTIKAERDTMEQDLKVQQDDMGRPGAINCVKVVVEFHPWFKLYFPLYQTHRHTLSYPKTKENII